MSISQVLETSTVISLFKGLYRRYCRIGQILKVIYYQSQIHRLITGFIDRTVVFFRYSFLGRIIQVACEEDPVVLNNSRVIRYLMETCKSWRDKANCYSNASLIINLCRQVKKEFYFFTVKTVCMFTLAAIMINTSLLTILGKQISLLGWLVRGAFLFIALGGLFCSADFKTIAETSLALKWIKRSKS